MYFSFICYSLIEDHIAIGSFIVLIKNEKLEFVFKISRKSRTNKNLSYEYFDSILLITKKPGQI